MAIPNARLKIAALAALLALPTIAHPADYLSSGKVTLARIHSSQISMSSVRGVTAFQLSVPLAGPCVWPLIAADDRQALGHLLLAKATGSDVTARYSDTPIPAWGDAQACYVTALDQ